MAHHEQGQMGVGHVPLVAGDAKPKLMNEDPAALQAELARERGGQAHVGDPMMDATRGADTAGRTGEHQTAGTTQQHQTGLPVDKSNPAATGSTQTHADHVGEHESTMDKVNRVMHDAKEKIEHAAHSLADKFHHNDKPAETGHTTSPSDADKFPAAVPDPGQSKNQATADALARERGLGGTADPLSQATQGAHQEHSSAA
eukprot:CAMPEP_0202038024 /NCGR_PEP_ID=MMETSP0962-20130828/5107_1 /ASSEMBLY_ACC=CAM_ASM_000488 /TAXON_ID=4773 /ORGANISM="Schizochytrium aggregatum, Strain ATCC28209" /LENGTH=200 /DNA_ID=CAMNT_0048602167 /DNA_START=105 /DNA_END=707 /DNA_ORIENTATION=+